MATDNLFIDNSVGDFVFIDFDTVKQGDTSYRIAGVAAPEVEIWTEDGYKREQPGGELAANQAAELARQGGFTEIVPKKNRFGIIEKDNYGRTIASLYNKEGMSWSDKAYLSGTLATDDFTDERGRQLSQEGKQLRLANMARGIPENLEDPWVQARLEREGSDKVNTAFFQNVKNKRSLAKDKALDEATWRQYQDRYGDYNPYKLGDVQYHTPGAKFDGSAISPMSTAWDASVLSMKEGLSGFMAATADMTNNEGEWAYNEERANFHKMKQGQLPTYINRIGDIDSIEDTGDYIAGLTGMMAPYLLGIAGSAAGAALFVPGTIAGSAALATGVGLGLSTGPMALVYAGQIYSDMEGENMDEKSVAAAYSGGIVMASLDRLGLRGLLKASEVLKKDTDRVIANALYDKASRAGETILTRADYLKWARSALVTDSAELAKALRGLVSLPITKKLVSKQFAMDAATGAVREGGTELLQEMTQLMAAVGGSQKEFDMDEAKDRAVNALAGGTIMGAMVSPPLATPSAIQSRRRTQKMYSIAAKQPVYRKWLLGKDSKTGQFKYDDASEIDGEQWLFGPQGWYDANNIDRPSSNITQKQIDKNDKEMDKYQEENKLKNKGVVQFLKDIGDNFVFRPTENYWKNPMSGIVNQPIEAGIAFYSPTNKDFVGGGTLWDKENKLLDTGRRMTQDITSKLRILYGKRNTRKSRIEMSKEVRRILATNNKNLTKAEIEIKQDMEALARFNVDVARKESNENIRYEDYTAETMFNTNRPSKKQLKKNEAEYKRILMEDQGNGFPVYTQAEADSQYENMMSALEGRSAKEAEPIMNINQVKLEPFSRFFSNAKLDVHNKKGMEQFVDGDNLGTLADTIREIVHKGLMHKHIGNKGIVLKTIIAGGKLRAKKDWDPKIGKDLISAAEIWMGSYNPIKNQFLKRLQANISSFNLVTILGTGGFAQIPEIISAMIGRISKEQGGRALFEDIQKIAKELAKHYKTSNSEIYSRFWKGTGVEMTDSWSPQRQRFTAGGRAGIQYGVLGQQGFQKQDIAASKLRAAIGMTFVTVSGIKVITDASRVIADFVGGDAIMHYLDVLDTFQEPGMVYSEQTKEAYDLLRETKMPVLRTVELYKAFKNEVVELHANKNLSFSDPNSFVEIETLMLSNPRYKELVTIMDKARKQWVDNFLANPNPATKSRPTNDPHYALLFQFRGFILTVFASILPRLIKRVTSGMPNQDAGTIQAIVGLIAMGFLAQALKDEFKTDGRPYWLDDLEYAQRGVQASGLLGPFDFLLDAVNPIYGEANAWNVMEGVMGPTWGSIKKGQRLVGSALEGDFDKAKQNALKFVPIAGHRQKFTEGDYLDMPFVDIL